MYDKDNLDLFDEPNGKMEEAAASQAVVDAGAKAEKYTPVIEDGKVVNDTSVTKCPACGANMVYSAERQKLYCNHCGAEKEIQEKRSSEQHIVSVLTDNACGWEDESHVFVCQTCGAREILDKNEIAKTCPFCGASNIVETGELPGLKPNAVVPFAINKESAGASVKKWIRKRLFAPRRFRKSAKPEKLEGVYTPAFTFDSITETDYWARLGEYYYVSVTRNGKTERVRKIRYFNVSGHYTMAHDDVLIQASGNIEQKFVDKMQPFNTNESQEYKKEYLSGFSATQYKKSGNVCWQEAQGVMEQRVKYAALGQYRYDVISSYNANTQHRNVTYKYVLLPVYVGHCKWGKKIYNLFVNGHSGKVAGKAPVSPIKVGSLVTAIIGVLVGLYFLFTYLG